MMCSRGKPALWMENDRRSCSGCQLQMTVGFPFGGKLKKNFHLQRPGGAVKDGMRRQHSTATYIHQLTTSPLRPHPEVRTSSKRTTH